MTDYGWIALVITIVVQLLVAAFVYGKLTAKVAEHDQRHNSHDTRFRELGDEQALQWNVIGQHGERLSAVETRCDVSYRERHDLP